MSPDPRPWYVARTKPRQEHTANSNLLRQGFATYLPNLKVIRRIRRRQELRLAIVVWIERKYHRQRAQDTLGGLTPIEFEAKLAEPLTVAA